MKFPGTFLIVVMFSASIQLAWSDSRGPFPAGRDTVNLVYHDFSSTPVTSGAYVQILAATSDQIHELDIFNSCGYRLFLATGAAAAESNKLQIVPGGNGRVAMRVSQSTRLSIKAGASTCSSGELIIDARK